MEIYIEIDLLLNTQQVSISPFWIDPAKLKEMKEKFKGLLYKGFIRPSISLWGAPLLFIKKKDGSLKMYIDNR